MPRSLSLTCLTAVLITTLTGCVTSTTPKPSVSANIDYSQQRYEETRFDKAGVTQPAKVVSFKADIDGCEMEAQQHYQEALASSAKLGAIYGQPITPQHLQKMKRLQVVSCMSAPGTSAQAGKGWTIIK